VRRYLDRVERGEVIVVCRRNVPIAEIRAVASSRAEPRPLGRAEGEFTVPSEFHEPLPDEILDAFEGRAGDGG